MAKDQGSGTSYDPTSKGYADDTYMRPYDPGKTGTLGDSFGGGTKAGSLDPTTSGTTDPTKTTSLGDTTDLTAYDPAMLGKLFGSKLTGYLTKPTPFFDKSLFTGMGDMTRMGLADALTTANRNAGGLQQGYDWTQGMIGSGGLTGGMRNGINGTTGIADQFGQMSGGAMDPSLTEQRFGNEEYGVKSPGYDTLRRKLSDDVTTGNLGAFNSSGMFGSDSNQESLAEGLGTALGGMDAEQYRYGEGLRRQDTQAIEQMRQQGFGNKMATLQGRLGALGQGFGMEQSGIDNTFGATDRLGSRFKELMLPSDIKRDIGSQYDADAQGKRMDEFDQFNRKNNGDYDRFRQLLGDFTGSQGNTGMEEETPWWQTLLGIGGDLLGKVF